MVSWKRERTWSWVGRGSLERRVDRDGGGVTVREDRSDSDDGNGWSDSFGGNTQMLAVLEAAVSETIGGNGWSDSFGGNA